MDLKVLRYFVSAVEAGSISGAAQRCHVAQPSITLAIAKLEDEFNSKLFDRHSKGSAPTAAGLKLYEMAKNLLSHAESIRNEFRGTVAKENLRLKVDKNIRVDVLERFLSDLQKESSNITLSLISPNDASQDYYDLQLTTEKQIDSKDWFYPLMTEHYCLLIPKSNQLAFKPTISIEDLQQQPLVTRIHCENKPLFDKICHNLGLKFNSVAEVETEEWAHALVRSGVGLCFAPLPSDMQDAAIEVRQLDSLLNLPIPERKLGLSVKPEKQAKVASLLPAFFTD